MQGAQKLRSEAHLLVRRSDDVAAQRRRWTFYKATLPRREGTTQPGESPTYLIHQPFAPSPPGSFGFRTDLENEKRRNNGKEKM
jgi:hypothetical protein